MGNTFPHDLTGGPNDLGMVAFRENDPFGVFSRLYINLAHHISGPVDLIPQLFSISLYIYGFSGDTGLDGGLGYGRCCPDQDTGIERLGNNVIRAELQIGVTIGPLDGFRDLFPGQVGQRIGGRPFHFFIDSRGFHIQSASENEGKAEHIIHLIGIITAARSDNSIRAGLLCIGVGYFRVGVGHAEDDRAGGHSRGHFFGQQPFYG